MISRLSRRRRPSMPWAALAFMLIFLMVRLWSVTAFPPFLDEAYHEQCVEKAIRTGPLICANDARLFTVWWYAPFQPQAHAAIWIMRAATLLALLPGYAAALAIGRLLTGRTGLVLVGLLLLFSLYHQFFDRMALGDTIAAWVLIVALYFGCRLTRRVSLIDAILMGVAIFIAVGFKLSVLPYIGLPLAAGLTLRPQGRRWRDNVRWTLVAFGTAVGLLVAFMIVLRLMHYDALTLLSVHNHPSGEPLTVRLIEHARRTVDLIVVYAGSIGTVLLVIALIILLVRRRFYLLLALLAPMVVLWVNETFFSRYFSPPFLILWICGAVALADVLRKVPQVRTAAIIALVVILGVFMWAPFAWAMVNNPVVVPLAVEDRAEYISSDASGFVLSEMRNKITQIDAQEVIGLFSSCVNLKLMTEDLSSEYQTPDRLPKVTCPTLMPSGINVPELAALVENNRRKGVYVIVENIPYVPQDIPGRVIYTRARPYDGTRLTLYELAPQ